MVLDLVVDPTKEEAPWPATPIGSGAHLHLEVGAKKSGRLTGGCERAGWERGKSGRWVAHLAPIGTACAERRIAEAHTAAAAEWLHTWLKPWTKRLSEGLLEQW